MKKISFSVDEVGKYEMKESPGEILLRQWGNRGQTVYDLLSRLQNLSKLYGGIVDTPQLILCRKYSKTDIDTRTRDYVIRAG